MAHARAIVAHWPRRVAVGMIRVYQVAASPFPSPCRFTPSCSTYALEAVERYGVVRGGWLGIRRLVRCHPFGGRGHDPVP
jgi:putative membrane protein insertion efficiency factor